MEYEALRKVTAAILGMDPEEIRLIRRQRQMCIRDRTYIRL